MLPPTVVTRWRLAHLEQENLIVWFDNRTRDVADQAVWNSNILQKRRARRRS